MTGVLSSGLVAGSIAAAVIGCGSAARPTAPPTGVTVAGEAPSRSVLQPRWDYHPKTPNRLRARLDLPDGTWLLAGNGGERWLADPRAATAVSAPVLADEDLVLITHPSSDTYAFVGAHGTLFLARSALGPFAEIVEPAQEIRQLTGDGTVLVGVQQDGSLVRSLDGGRTFLSVPFAAGPVADIALAHDGRALVLTLPEQLWYSTNGGASFARAKSRGVGAMSVAVDARDRLVVRGLSQALAWTRGTEPVLEPLEGLFEPAPLDLLTEPSPGPSGLALSHGSATLVGDRYYEMIPPEKTGKEWSLALSSIAGRATVQRVGRTESCTHFRIAGWGEALAMVCLVGGRRGETTIAPSARLLYGRSPGFVFESRPIEGLVVDQDSARALLLPSGTVLLSGGCKPADRRICQPGPPIRLAVQAGSTLRIGSVAPSETPMLWGPAGVPVHSLDGRRVYVGVRLAVGRALALLISDDDGVSFRAVPIEPASLGTEDARSAVETAQPGRLGVDEAGNVSWVLTTAKGILWIMFDRDGRAQSAQMIPQSGSELVAVGRHALSFSTPEGSVAESNDGGKTFDKIARLPIESLADGERSALACSAAGCAIGTSYSRQGWGEAPAGIAERKAPRVAAKPARDPMLTPIACRVRQGQWQELIGNQRGQPVVAHNADLAGAAWWVGLADPKSGSVSLAVGHATPQPRVERITLFAPSPRKDVALGVVPQAEGLAAIRIPFERDSSGHPRVGGALRNVEVAWFNLTDPGVRRATLADAGVLMGGDLTGGWNEGVASASPSVLLSISPDGMFGCPHASCEGTSARAFFVDVHGRARPVAYPVWPVFADSGEGLRVRNDFIRVDGRDVPAAFVQNNLAFALAFRAEAGFEFETVGLLSPAMKAQGYSTHFSWAFSGASRAVCVAVVAGHPTEPHAYSRLLQLRGTAGGGVTVLPAPRPSGLGEPPRACDAQQRKNTFRIIAPAEGGARHVIRIEGDDGRTIWLMSDDAVLYGTPEQPCVSVFDTVSPPRRSSNVQGLVNVADMSRSWVFETRAQGTFRWRSMECRFDASMKVPVTFPAQAAGTEESNE